MTDEQLLKMIAFQAGRHLAAHLLLLLKDKEDLMEFFSTYGDKVVEGKYRIRKEYMEERSIKHILRVRWFHHNGNYILSGEASFIFTHRLETIYSKRLIEDI